MRGGKDAMRIIHENPIKTSIKLTEFHYGPLHGTKMRIVGEPGELLFIVHGKRAVYTRVSDLDGEPVYYDADEWESFDADPYAEQEGGTA